MIILTNNFFDLIEENGKVLIKTTKIGFSLKEFDGILRSHPRIKLTNFVLLKNALGKESNQPKEIGQWLPQIEIEVANDKMSASMFIHETADTIRQDEQKMIAQVKEVLKQYNIVHGIVEIDLKKIVPGKACLIAQGTPPIPGDDAKITYLQIPERKPVIGEDGKADYFDMNFIFEIKEGDWLGEKIPPKPGINGTTVHGEQVAAPFGKDAPIKYDPKSAYETEEDGKIVIYSSTSGVVENRQGLISVNRHLPLEGDVGVETGNIKFDGSITVKGTVMNGFSLTATGDISIEGSEGVTGAKLIKSTEGDVYIKGGVFGMGETVVEAGGSIFVKHVNDANLFAEENIVIGFYSLGSYLVANNSIMLDERKGKIIGGKAIAKNSIITAISGNYLERRTELIIDSLNKQDVLEKIQQKAAVLKATNEEITQISNRLEQVAPIKDKLNEQQLQGIQVLEQEIEKKKEYIVTIDHEIKELMMEMKSVGKEEIIVKKEAHAGTIIQIGKKSSLITKETKGTFLIEFGELNV